MSDKNKLTRVPEKLLKKYQREATEAGVKILDWEHGPERKDELPAFTFRLPFYAFVQMIKFVCPAVDKRHENERRRGVIMQSNADGFRLVGTDSFSLHYASLHIEEDILEFGQAGNVHVPVCIFRLMQSIERRIPKPACADIEIAFSKNLIVFRLDNVTFAIELLQESDTSGYRKSELNNPDHRIMLETSEFRTAMENIKPNRHWDGEDFYVSIYPVPSETMLAHVNLAFDCGNTCEVMTIASQLLKEKATEKLNHELLMVFQPKRFWHMNAFSKISSDFMHVRFNDDDASPINIEAMNHELEIIFTGVYSRRVDGTEYRKRYNKIYQDWQESK